MQKEIWKDIENYEGIYKVSNTGRVKSLERIVKSRWKPISIKERIMKLNPDSAGYLCLRLSKRHTTTGVNVHRLVAMAFIANPQNKPCVNHIDGNKLNNNVDNLEWVTHSENSKHTYENGFTIMPCGEKARNVKLKRKEVLKIREMLKDGIKQRVIAEQFKISRPYVSCIKNGKSWKHLQ